MRIFSHTVSDALGLHARPAGLLVKEAQKYQCKISLTAGDKAGDACRILSIMKMGVKQGQMLTFSISGVDEDTAAVELEQFCKNNI